MLPIRSSFRQYAYLARPPECPPVPWGKFCRDPYIMGDVCLSVGAGGNLHMHQYAHVAPMTHCFATADGAPAGA